MNKIHRFLLKAFVGGIVLFKRPIIPKAAAYIFPFATLGALINEWACGSIVLPIQIAAWSIVGIAAFMNFIYPIIFEKQYNTFAKKHDKWIKEKTK